MKQNGERERESSDTARIFHATLSPQAPRTISAMEADISKQSNPWIARACNNNAGLFIRRPLSTTRASWKRFFSSTSGDAITMRARSYLSPPFIRQLNGKICVHYLLSPIVVTARLASYEMESDKFIGRFIIFFGIRYNPGYNCFHPFFICFFFIFNIFIIDWFLLQRFF